MKFASGAASKGPRAGAADHERLRPCGLSCRGLAPVEAEVIRTIIASDVVAAAFLYTNMWTHLQSNIPANAYQCQGTFEGRRQAGGPVRASAISTTDSSSLTVDVKRSTPSASRGRAATNAQSLVFVATSTDVIGFFGWPLEYIHARLRSPDRRETSHSNASADRVYERTVV